MVAKLIALVVLPVPPFRLMKEIIFAINSRCISKNRYRCIRMQDELLISAIDRMNRS